MTEAKKPAAVRTYRSIRHFGLDAVVRCDAFLGLLCGRICGWSNVPAILTLPSNLYLKNLQTDASLTTLSYEEIT
ncbi:MAG: hypothetical protein ABJR23_06505, partial [Paracoccaceae bacterium]